MSTIPYVFMEKFRKLSYNSYVFMKKLSNSHIYHQKLLFNKPSVTLPAAQGPVGSVSPSVSQYMPAVQAVQSPWALFPVAFEYVPAGHFAWLLVDPDSEKIITTR